MITFVQSELMDPGGFILIGYLWGLWSVATMISMVLVIGLLLLIGKWQRSCVDFISALRRGSRTPPKPPTA